MRGVPGTKCPFVRNSIHCRKCIPELKYTFGEMKHPGKTLKLNHAFPESTDTLPVLQYSLEGSGKEFWEVFRKIFGHELNNHKA